MPRLRDEAKPWYWRPGLRPLPAQSQPHWKAAVTMTGAPHQVLKETRIVLN